MTADLLAQVRAEIDGRLSELRPAVAEYERLLGAATALESSAAALEISTSAPHGASPVSDGPIEIGSQAEQGALAAAQQATSRRAAKAPAAKAKPTARRQPGVGPVEQAIVAALEHGSHTLSELGVVTAMPASALREGLRRLLTAGKVTRASREGRAAYALFESEQG
jgi:hypothetical protein